MKKNFKKLMIASDEKIFKAIEILDNTEKKIVLVTDEKKRLLGTITDGDIRRGLIKKIEIDQSVNKIMNKKPIYISHHISRNDALNIMKDKDILHLPITDKEKKIIDIYFANESTAIQMKNTVLLMAGGFGKRLFPITAKIPKPMIKIGGKPILERIIENFKGYGFVNFEISTHYLPSKIKNYFKDGKKWNINISYINEDQPLGTAGSIALIKNKDSLPIILANGDIITDLNFEELLKFHNKHNAEITLVIKEYNVQVPYGVVETNNLSIKKIHEKPNQKFHINSGVYVINRSIIKNLKKNKALSMSDLINKSIKLRKKIMAFPIHEQWIDVGEYAQLDKARKNYLNSNDK